MDQLQISPETQQGLQNLSAKDKQELNQFIVGETQKAQVQSSMSRLSSLHACAFIKLAYACL
jgi:import inner membrane translocase subunit TIM8